MKVGRLVVVSILAVAAAVLPARGGVVQLEPARILRQVMPAFPHAMLQLGVLDGSADVAFSVDPKGNVDDCLAVAYTAPAFGEAAVNAVRSWRFIPARQGGQPVASIGRIQIRFKMQGPVLVSVSPEETAAGWLYRVGHNEAFQAVDLTDLDRAPRALVQPAPIYPVQLAREGRTGQVEVTFYIDPTGAVRLPSVSAAADPALAALAIRAIEHWKFTPPMHDGRPTLALATQEFNFR